MPLKHKVDSVDTQNTDKTVNIIAGTGITATAVGGNGVQIDNSDTGATAHLADTTDAHDASAISILDTANDFTATDVEGALAELQADAEALAAKTYGPNFNHGGFSWVAANWVQVTAQKAYVFPVMRSGIPATTIKLLMNFGTGTADVGIYNSAYERQVSTGAFSVNVGAIQWHSAALSGTYTPVPGDYFAVVFSAADYPYFPMSEVRTGSTDYGMGAQIAIASDTLPATLTPGSGYLEWPCPIILRTA